MPTNNLILTHPAPQIDFEDLSACQMGLLLKQEDDDEEVEEEEEVMEYVGDSDFDCDDVAVR